MNILLDTYKLLKKISGKKTENFTGVGLVIYNPECFDENCHCNLRPDIECPNYHIADDRMCDYLLEIADHDNTLHDGFHMIDSEGILTHVAQYFVPPVNQSLKPNQGHGVRLYSSMCGSVLEGVLYIGVVSSNYDIYIFSNGDYVNLNEIEGRLTDEK